MSTEELIVKPIGNKHIKQQIDAFCDLITENKDKKFFICSHDNPDPDSISSAFGISYILDFFGVTENNIYYCGEISHPQNRAMHNILNITLTKWDAEIERESEDGIIIFVDCAGKQRNMSIDVCPHIVIDHHKIISTINKNTLLIQDEIGACATLVTDLMLSVTDKYKSSQDGTRYKEEKEVCFNLSTEICKDVITALSIGIKTDTLDFRNDTVAEDDFKAYKLLSRFLSEEKFTKIINYELPPYMFDYEAIVWKNKNLNAPTLISGLGFIEESHSDCVPYLADKMMRLKGIQTVIIYAIVGNAVKASIRTIDASTDAGMLCNDLFGPNNGGGKHGVAGAKVQFSVFDIAAMSKEEKEILWSLVKSTYETKFAKIVGK